MAQNPELEAQIAKAPDDPAAYAVYADWLTERGDPRGELIAVQLRREHEPEATALAARAEALHAQWDASWLGALAGNADVAVTWRRGFVDEAVLGTRGYGDLTASAQAELYAALRGLPAAAVLRALTFGAISNDDGEPSWQHAIDALVAHGAPAALRSLAFERGDYWDISWTHLGALAAAYPVLGALEQLAIELGHMDLGTIVLPALRGFTVRTGGFTQANMRSIVDATWPRLEKLALTFGGNEDYGADCTADDVLPLFTDAFARRHEHLRHLGLANAPFTDALIPQLARSPILRQLESLDLSQGLLSDAGVEALVAHADAFRHLAFLDASDSYLTFDGVAALRGVIPNAAVEDQKDPDDDWRYCEIGE